MNQTKISAEIVAHSISPQGDEIISVLATFPRIILAEVNTHRMLGKNTSSSRAIPFFKMVKSISENPFIPMAFQEHHSGMQGNQYLSPTEKITWRKIQPFITEEIQKNFYNEQTGDWDKDYLEIDKAINQYLIPLFVGYKEGLTPAEWWLKIRDLVVSGAIIMYSMGVTKQLANRLLEPFMWTTMLITGPKSGWENFFKLRCPQYTFDNATFFKSKKEACLHIYNGKLEPNNKEDIINDLDWFKINKGQAEIHMMALAECIWDAYNESTPKQLSAGQWHIPFYDQIVDLLVSELPKNEGAFIPEEKITKISTAMAAHTSYTVVGGEAVKSSEKWLELHDKLISYDPPHSSPMEHCARTMSEFEYLEFYKGKLEVETIEGLEYLIGNGKHESHGWCNNLKGFIPYRYFIDNGLSI